MVKRVIASTLAFRTKLKVLQTIS